MRVMQRGPALEALTIGVAVAAVIIAGVFAARNELLVSVAVCFVAVVPVAALWLLTPRREPPTGERLRERRRAAGFAVAAVGVGMSLAALVLALLAPSQLVALLATMGPGAILGGASVMRGAREEAVSTPEPVPASGGRA